jgi:hypothetical protein
MRVANYVIKVERGTDGRLQLRPPCGCAEWELPVGDEQAAARVAADILEHIDGCNVETAENRAETRENRSTRIEFGR